jgi:tetratricopeptide (TPR) repeat protein
MARVYVSSTVADLADEREAVIDWLVRAGHQPVHSYRPDSESVRDSCLDDIDGCDLYVLIQGHRYGFQPEDRNPDQLSITHLEFRRAAEAKVPRVALLRTNVPDIRLSDLQDPARATRVLAFITEVQHEVRSGEFGDLEGLISALSTAVQHELARAKGPSEKSVLDSRVLDIVATLTDELARKTRTLDQRTDENLMLRGRVSELEQELRAAVERTLVAAAQPGAAPATIAAATALEAGQTGPAEVLLGKQERHEASQIGLPGADDADQRRAARTLAREQGALAMSHDVRAALASFQRAAEYDPDDIWTHFFIGDLHVSLGDSAAGLTAYRAGHSIAQDRAAHDPASTERQRLVSAGQNRMGDVLLAQGEGAGALAAYQAALSIAEALTAREPANALLQEDVSVSLNKVGDVLLAEGDLPGALAAFRKALAIREALAASNPANTEWQSLLAASLHKVGNVLMIQADAPSALAAFRRGLAIAETLLAGDPTDTKWQRDVSVSLEKIGDVLIPQGDSSARLERYRQSLAIREALVACDQANTTWQRDLSVSLDKLGSVLAARGDDAGALAAFRRGLAIREALAARNPANTDWQRDLSYSLTKLAFHHEHSGDLPEALRLAERSLHIDRRLSELDRTNATWQKDVRISARQVARLRKRIDQLEQPAQEL